MKELYSNLHYLYILERKLEFKNKIRRHTCEREDGLGVGPLGLRKLERNVTAGLYYINVTFPL